MDLPGRRVRFVAAFAAIYILWGSTYLAIALGLRSVPPLLLMGGRSVLAALVLLGFSQLRNPGCPPAREWLLAAIGGLLLFAGCHGTLAYAEQYVPSGLAAVVLATIPFWIATLNFLVPGAGRRPKVGSVAGLLPGLAGVALIGWRGAAGGGAIQPAMVGLLLAAAFSWAAGSVVCQRHAVATPAIALSGIQLLCGGLVLLAASALTGELDNFSPAEVSAMSWAALAYLALAGSVIAFTAYVWLLDHAPGPIVATYTFVNPVIAVALGWAALGERPGLPTLLGMILVVGSVALAWRLDDQSSEWRSPKGEQRAKPA